MVSILIVYNDNVLTKLIMQLLMYWIRIFRTLLLTATSDYYFCTTEFKHS
jgi:hypothetical protein